MRKKRFASRSNKIGPTKSVRPILLLLGENVDLPIVSAAFLDRLKDGFTKDSLKLGRNHFGTGLFVLPLVIVGQSHGDDDI